ncbi:MAG TPA: thermonuclease family protein [Kofleriaceae bacterium]|nr:thermonuclease family protein [Kofleriaceae bacterium]
MFAVQAVRDHAARIIAAALAAALALALAPALSGCAGSEASRRYSRDQVQASLKRLETPGLLVGEFTLAPTPVLDGDTIRVEGLDSTLRLLALDAEETIKDAQSRREVGGDWATYTRNKRGQSPRPKKFGTPMGEEAKVFAKHFFDGVDRVRLERDHPKEIRDLYGRYLAYAFVRKNGRWVNYNLEAVRAGMSPYFTKYSYSRRFHDQFVAAEKEARAARRGIWDPTKRTYPDYDERKAWWDARGRFIRMFEQDAQGRDDFIELTQWDSLARIEKSKGREVTVLGAVGRVFRGDRGPSRVMLSRQRSSDLAIIFFDKDVFASSGIASYAGEFVRVSGVVSEYTNKYTHRRQLQLIVNLPSQVVLSDVPGVKNAAQAAARH